MSDQARLSIIAAIGENRELGRANALLWNIPEDMAWFREKTNGHPVIMGRVTYESIGRLLPGRDNIIITRDRTYQLPGAFVTYSLDEAVAFARERARDEVFVIGGGQIYEAAIEFADRLYLTVVHTSFPDADTFFPDYSSFSKVVEKRDSSDSQYSYTFFTLDRE